MTAKRQTIVKSRGHITESGVIRVSAIALWNLVTRRVDVVPVFLLETCIVVAVAGNFLKIRVLITVFLGWRGGGAGTAGCWTCWIAGCARSAEVAHRAAASARAGVLRRGGGLCPCWDWPHGEPVEVLLGKVPP